MDSPYEITRTILQAGTAGSGFASLELYGASVQPGGTDDGACRRFHLENESGTGEIALYPVFPGIELIYNDMHMGWCNRDQPSASDMLEINYCRQGRCECLFGSHQYCYMSAGDLSLCSLQGNAHQSEFPTAHYCGITVTVDFSGITPEMQAVLALLAVDLSRIRALAFLRDFTILRASPAAEHIFSELYTVPPRIRHGYIRVKVLELLLVLTELDQTVPPADRERFTEAQIVRIKRVRSFLLAHFDEHYTIDALAERFALSPTALKKCFRGVYGDSVYSYMKHYRLQAAERLLKESDLTVSEIAARIGYANPNKFTSAFCAEYGIPPREFRKRSEENPNG